MKNFIILISILFISISAFGQKKYPFSILPSSTYTITTNNDTLWVLKHKQFKKTIEYAKKYKLCSELDNLQKLQISKLKEQGAEKDSLIIILTEDRDTYMDYWEECNDDIKTLGRMNKRQKKITRIVTIVGITTTVLAFVGGVFLGLQ